MRPLGGVVADAACATRNEYQLIGNGAIRKDAAVSGHDGYANAGPHLKRSILGQCWCAHAIERNVLRGRTQLAAVLRLIHKHPFTDARRRHALTHCGNHTRAIAMGYHWPSFQ